MKLQDAIEILCQRKRFHVIVFTLLALNFMFIPIHIFVDLFLSYEPKHYCAYPQEGSKYQWIPYNHESHSFDSCAIYQEPLTKEMEEAEKKKIEEESYHKDVKVWDWKALKFKSKHHYGDHKHDHVAHDDHEGHNETSEDHDPHRRRRREQRRPPPSAQPDPADLHRFINEDGQPVEGGAAPEGAHREGGPGSDAKDGDVAPAAESASDGTEGGGEKGAEDKLEAVAEPVDEEHAEAGEPAGAEDHAALSDTVHAEDRTEHSTPADADDQAEDDSTEGDVIVHRFELVPEATEEPSGVGAPHEEAAPDGEDVIVHRFPTGDEERYLLGGSPGGRTPEPPAVHERPDEPADEPSDEPAAEPGPSDHVQGHDPPGAAFGGHGHDGGRPHDQGHDEVQPHDQGHKKGHEHDHGHGGSQPDEKDHGRGTDHDHGRDHDGGHGGDDTEKHGDGGDRKHGDHGGNHGHDDGHGEHGHGSGAVVAASKDRSAHKEKSSGKYGHKGYLHNVIPCQHGIHYQGNVGTTLTTYYGLSCSNDVSVITNTVLGTAMVAGAIIFAPFVDKYGRKTLFMMVCCQNCLISLGIAFVGDIRSYWVLRFLSRFYIEGVEIALLVLAVEMAPSKSRPIAPLILYVAYAIGQILLSLQAMLFRSWWKLQLAISVESIVLIPFSWFLVPESIHWLVSMRRHQDAEKLIRLGCRLNGIILPSDFHLDKPGKDEDEGSDEEATGNGYHGSQPRKSAAERLRSKQLNLKNRPGAGEYLQHEFHAHIGEWRKILDLMKNHQLRRHFFIVSYMWAIVGFCYYGLTASTMVMKGNVYLNYCLSGLVMIPASVSIFILRRFGRKKPIFYFLIGAGIFIILSVTCPYKTPDGVDMYPVYLAIKLMAKYCVVSCLISIRLLIIELFPTPVRGTLIGLTAFIGLLGSALGYYFLELITFSKWVGVVVGALALLAAGLSRLLPETSHRPLPDTINDMMAACREMFLNLLVAMPNMPRPEEPAPTPQQARPKRNLSALSAFSAVLSWRSRSKSAVSADAPVRSMSDEDFKRPPHPPLSSMASAPLPHDGDDVPPPTMRSLVQRVREAEAAAARPTLREKLARALSQRRQADGERALSVPPPRRRSSSTPSLAAAARRQLGVDNPQYEAEAEPASPPRVSFDLLRADSCDGTAVNGLEGARRARSPSDGGSPPPSPLAAAADDPEAVQAAPEPAADAPPATATTQF